MWNQKRQHILQSATESILENDYHALTLDAVAKQAGIIAKAAFEECAKKDPLEKGKWYSWNSVNWCPTMVRPV